MIISVTLLNTHVAKKKEEKKKKKKSILYIEKEDTRIFKNSNKIKKEKILFKW